MFVFAAQNNTSHLIQIKSFALLKVYIFSKNNALNVYSWPAARGLSVSELRCIVPPMGKQSDDISRYPHLQIFADEYMLTHNITTAAVKAGSTKISGRTTGRKWLSHPAVIKYMTAQSAKLAKKADRLQDKVLAELEAIAMSNLGDFVTVNADGQLVPDFSKATPEQLRVLKTVRYKQRDIYTPKGEFVGTEKQSSFEMHDKLRGLELTGRHLNMFKGEETTIVIDVADRLLAARRRVALLPAPSTSDDASDT